MITAERHQRLEQLNDPDIRHKLAVYALLRAEFTEFVGDPVADEDNGMYLRMVREEHRREAAIIAKRLRGIRRLLERDFPV